MKKTFARILLTLLLVCMVLMPCICVAETVTETTAVMEGLTETTRQPFTWAQLLTIGGATLATSLIVQCTKGELDKLWKIPTKIYAYFIGLLILVLATIFTGNMTPENGVLCFVNAFLVALGSYGTYDVATSIVGTK